MASDHVLLTNRLRAILVELESIPDPGARPITAPLVTEARLAALVGMKPKGLEGLRARGLVTEGVHYHRLPTGRIGWDTDEFRRWQEGVSCPVGKVSECPEAKDVRAQAG